MSRSNRPDRTGCNGDEREAIEIVAGDRSRWIDTCVREYFPNAARCIDFFHVVEWANDALDKVRSSTAAKAAREYNRRKEEYAKAEQEAEEAVRSAREELVRVRKREMGFL
ncbi:MAG: transposase [Stomatobaculum sp.]